MKKTLLALAAVVAAASASADELTVKFSDLGYTDQNKIESVNLGAVATMAFYQVDASTPATYYNIGSAIRVYNKSSFTITGAEGVTITNAVFAYASGYGFSAETTAAPGTFADNVWTGEANAFTVVVGAADRHVRLQSVTLTYTSTTDIPDVHVVGVPSFSLDAGEVEDGTELTLTTAADCTLAYTVNGAAGQTGLSEATITLTRALAEANDGSIVVAARSVDAQGNESAQVERTYTIKPEAIVPTGETVAENFAAANTWFECNTKALAQTGEVTTYTSPETEIAYTSQYAYASSGNGLILLGNATEAQRGWVSFSLPFDCTAIILHTGKNASTAATFNVYADGVALMAQDITTANKDADYQVNIPQGQPQTIADTDAPVYKVAVTNTKNAQFASMTYVKKDTETGISGVCSDGAQAVYYDLTGRRVAQPVNGVYVRVQGGKAVKVVR